MERRKLISPEISKLSSKQLLQGMMSLASGLAWRGQVVATKPALVMAAREKLETHL
jgi:hypothetical protein